MQNYKAPDNSIHFLEDDSFTHLLPAGSVLITREEADMIREAAKPQPTQGQIIEAFTAQIQERLDAFARTRNYDGILSACTYATSSVQKFSVEGQRAVDLRDQTWAAAYSILDEVLNGQREMPATLDDVEPDLPVLSWSN